MSPLKFRIADILWITALTAALLGWWVDRAQQRRDVERTVEVMQLYKSACVSYRQELTDLGQRYRATRAMSDELERRLSKPQSNKNTAKLTRRF